MLVLAVKRRWPAALAVVAALVLAVVAIRGRCAPPTPRPAALGDVAAWNARAGDASLDRAARCGAVFALFEHHLAPGMTSAVAAGVITDRSWISVDNPVEILGGWIPVELDFDDSTFVVHCDAAPRADLDGRLWSDWVIYGRIAGKDVRTLSQFLAAPSDAVLVEYALCHPDGRIERYGPETRRTTIRGPAR